MFADENIAVDAVFNPAVGPAVPCRVVLEKDVLLQPGAMTAQAYERATTIEAILADLGKEPARGETFDIGAESFTVQYIDENDGLSVRMIVT